VAIDGRSDADDFKRTGAALAELQVRVPLYYYCCCAPPRAIAACTTTASCFYCDSVPSHWPLSLSLSLAQADAPETVWRTLAAILHLGNLTFENDNEQCAFVSSEPSLAAVAALLTVDVADLRMALCTRQMAVPAGTIRKPQTAAQADDMRDSLATAMYSSMFVWLVGLVNSSLAAPHGAAWGTIGVLDIYGFENFNVNLFEQLLINFANEKLQAQFNQRIFADEQALYEYVVLLPFASPYAAPCRRRRCRPTPPPPTPPPPP
jgi:hypothetical protein